MVIIIFFWMPIIKMEPTNVHKLDSSGIYIEPFGSAVVYSNQWTIAGTVEIPDWDNTILQIIKSKSLITDFCEKRIIDLQHCKSWQHRLDNRIRDGRDRIEHIKFFNNEKPRNSKRGLINVVGHVSKFLFGTMDSTDEEEIKASLSKLENQRENSWNFLDKQVTLMCDNFALITAPINSLKENQINITNTVNKIISQNENLTGRIASIELVQKLEENVENSMDNLDNIIRSLNKFITIYSSLVAHQLPIELIETGTLLKIYRELVKEKHLNINLIKKEIFFEIATVRWTQIENTLVYKIQFPTEMTESLDVANVIPYPVQNPNGSFLITKIQRNILLSSEKQVLFLTKEGFYTGCKKLRSFDVEHLFLCDAVNLEPLIKRDNESKINIPVSREVLVESMPRVRLQLHDPNSFLFKFQTKQKIFSICDGQTFETELIEAGICKLNNSCVHSLNNEIIHTSKQKTLLIPREKMQLDLNIEPTNISTSETMEKINELRFNSSEDFQDYFSKINDNFVGLKKLAQEEKDKERNNNFTIGSMSFSGTTLLILVVVFVYINRQQSAAPAAVTLNSAPSGPPPCIISLLPNNSSDRPPVPPRNLPN